MLRENRFTYRHFDNRRGEGPGDEAVVSPFVRYCVNE